MLRPAAFCWLLIFLLFDPPDVAADQHIPAAEGGVKRAGPDKIVEFHGPVMLKKGVDFTDVFVKVKSDSEEEDVETFSIILQDVSAIKNRVKRGAGGRGRGKE